MWPPIVQLFGVAALCCTVIFAAPLAERLTVQQTMPQCAVGKWPEFNFGFSALRLDLDAEMGDAAECEHATTANGDTDQLTTTGLAHYDQASNTPSFHRGQDNWALTASGLVFWAGTEADVPPAAIPVPSPGSARLAAAFAVNSAALGHGVLGGDRQAAPPGSIASEFLTTTQVAGVAKLIGIKNDKVDSMTIDEVSNYTQESGGSVAKVTRAMNTATP